MSDDVVIVQTTTNQVIVQPITNQLIVETPGPQGATGEAGLIQSPGFKSGEFFGAQVIATTNTTATLNRTNYMPFYLSETTTFDSIAIRTGSNFSGTAVVRLGVYNNSGGIPTTVAFDAGTVSATVASTNYPITINQTLNAGWYWLASNTQTAATTNSFTGSTGITYPAMMKYANSFSFNAPCWYESSISGAFATAGTLVESQGGFIVVLRKA
jgi:hypothetical protein